jgi:hypothetical protein
MGNVMATLAELMNRRREKRRSDILTSQAPAW